MNKKTPMYTFAVADYGCNAYGGDSYSASNCSTNQTTAPTSPLDTALAYTGTPMFGLVAGAVLLIVVATVVILRQFRGRAN